MQSPTWPPQIGQAGTLLIFSMIFMIISPLCDDAGPRRTGVERCRRGGYPPNWALTGGGAASHAACVHPAAAAAGGMPPCGAGAAGCCGGGG